MATSYASPTGLDLSACTVVPAGGTDPQSLSDMGKSVADANKAAVNAAGDASAAKKAVDDLDFTGFLKASDLGTANGPAKLDAYGNLASGNADLTLGVTGANAGRSMSFYGSDAANPDVKMNFFPNGGQGYDGDFWVFCHQISPATDNLTSLGTGSNRYTQVCAASGTIVTSDVTVKKDITLLSPDLSGHASEFSIGLPSDVSAKLLTIGRKIPFVVFSLDDGKRIHAGTIAQIVEKLFTDEGLNAADYGVWCQDALVNTVFSRDDKGQEVMTSKPVLTPGGAQVYRQSIRYDQLLVLALAAERADRAALEARIVALEGKGA